MEPPCEKLNPASEGMYDVLETTYSEFLANVWHHLVPHGLGG